MVFLFFGIGKFLGGVGDFATGMQQRFAGKLPSALVALFAYALPFAEVMIGALLVVGLFSVFALTFGTVVLGEAPTVAHNLQYALVNFVLLGFADYNGYSIDRRLRRGGLPVKAPQREG